MTTPPDAQAPGSEGTTIGQRLRAFAADLVGHAFVSDMHNLDGRGVREVEELTDLFEAKVLRFMLREKRLELERAPPRPEPSEAGETAWKTAWKLVPVEATDKMRAASRTRHFQDCITAAQWRAVLAAAPPPPTEPTPQDAAAIKLTDPRITIAGIRQFGLASDGSDLRDLESAFARLSSLSAKGEVGR